MSIQEANGDQMLLEQLHERSQGLQYVSESDYPFEVVNFSSIPANSDVASLLRQRMISVTADTKIEVEDLAYFFRNHTDSTVVEEHTAQRFLQLQTFLTDSLQEAKVYKVGARRITVLILGETVTGAYAGLKTVLIET
jgi:hypothetical protein